MDQLSLLNSDIHFTQAKTGLKLTARVERLSRNLGPAFGGLVIDAKGELDGEPVEISGKVELEGRELPSEGDVPLQIKAGLGELRLDWTGRAGSDRIAVDGDAMLGKTKLMGKIVLDLGKERPLVSAEIESRLLDFADFEALPWVGGDGKANGKKGKPARNSGKGKATDKGPAIADTSMGFGFLEEADVDLKLKIDKIKGAKRTASEVTGQRSARWRTYYANGDGGYREQAVANSSQRLSRRLAPRHHLEVNGGKRACERRTLCHVRSQGPGRNGAASCAHTRWSGLSRHIAGSDQIEPVGIDGVGHQQLAGLTLGGAGLFRSQLLHRPVLGEAGRGTQPSLVARYHRCAVRRTGDRQFAQ